MDPVTLLIILVVLLIVFGGWGYGRRGAWAGGNYMPDLIGLIVFLVVCYVILKVLHLL